MQAGFIGLGTMGASMAANLQKGLKARGDTLVVHDIRRDAASRHLRDGAIWADTPQAVAEQSEVIFTSLPGPPEFESTTTTLAAVFSNRPFSSESVSSTRGAASLSMNARRSCG